MAEKLEARRAGTWRVADEERDEGDEGQQMQGPRGNGGEVCDVQRG